MDLFIFFGFQPKIPFLAKFGPKNQIWQFKVKRDTQNKSKIQDSVGLLTFFVFDWNYPFLGKFDQIIFKFNPKFGN